MRVRVLNELASGIDAFYLSGRATLPQELLKRLKQTREEADVLEGSPPFQFGNVEMQLAPHAFGKHRYCLTHPNFQIGVSPKLSIPAFRIQPRAEYLHGVGPHAFVDTITTLLESECGIVKLQVSRVDLFVDVQGWPLKGDDRATFVCRAKELNTSEVDQALTGLQFGKRSTGTLNARIYDKTEEIKKSGSEYWKDIWGEMFDSSLPVHRIEFEIARESLREFGLNDPSDVIEATGALWSYATNWLSHRVPTKDETRSRWPVSVYWQDVRRAHIANESWGLERVRKGKQRGELAKVFPPLVGYLARFGALMDSRSDIEMFDDLKAMVPRFCAEGGDSMTHRIFKKRRELGLA